jgi:hypothetical protein
MSQTEPAEYIESKSAVVARLNQNRAVGGVAGMSVQLASDPFHASAQFVGKIM